MLNVKFRKTARTNITGLKKFPQVLSKNIRKGLFAVGKRFVISSQARMREDTKTAKRSLKIVVKGSGLDLGVLVFSSKVQAIVDAVGLPRGTFPPFGEGSRIMRWAKRKALSQSPRVKRYAVPKRTLFQLNRNFERRQKLKKIDRVKKFNAPRRPGNKRIRAQNNAARRMAFLAARTIFRRGIRATHWNRKALEANKSSITREIQNSIVRAMAEVGRG